MSKTKELSGQELAVLQHLIAGLTYRQIAKRLHIGYETVRTYMDRIRSKCGKRNRTQIAVWAVQMGLVDGID